MVLIAGVALVVIGPEKFPEFAKIVLRTFRDLRGYVEEAKRDISEELRPVKRELDDLSRHKPEDYIDSLMGSSAEGGGGEDSGAPDDASEEYDPYVMADDLEGEYEPYGAPGEEDNADTGEEARDAGAEEAPRHTSDRDHEEGSQTPERPPEAGDEGEQVPMSTPDAAVEHGAEPSTETPEGLDG